MQNYYDLKQCYIIAEIGVNHNGDMDLAKKMIDAAIDSGADAVKFQTFKAESLVSKNTPKVSYQKTTTSPKETHYQMIKKLELKEDQYFILKEYCDDRSIEFISTPYDPDSVDLLEKLGVKQYKVASADLVDYFLLNRVAETNKQVLLSVGMASMGEIEDALNIFAKYNNNNVLLLHCVSNYPCSDESLNLRVIQTLQSAFSYPVGLSDHSVGIQASVLSLALGVKLIEKHFTLDKTLPGPDQKASSSPEEFTQLVKAVRRAEKMLGSNVKKCQEEEQQMLQISRKSLFLAKNIKKGQIITLDHLVMKRPGNGLGGKFIDDILGLKARKDLEKDTLITFDVLL